MNHATAVEFATPTRIHVAVAVRDLEASLPFYRSLFGQEPTKVRHAYAKFEVADPPVNFTLNEHAPTGPRLKSPEHFGVQVKSTEAVRALQARLESSGIGTEVEDSVTCCYAVADKIWARDPDGHQWEIFVVTDADADTYARSPAVSAPVETQAERSCCAPDCCQ
jgi:catechol 2,3-dioxygenase-like lactoylglutathione lyase family enzyme